MSNPNSNPAALEGWMKSKDPKSGRFFYANSLTRKTQWEAPPGWKDEPDLLPPPPPLEDEEDALPSNWEEMHDPSSGKSFYVDHVRKITTWKRPTTNGTQTSSSSPRKNTTPSNAFARILSSAAETKSQSARNVVARTTPAAPTRAASYNQAARAPATRSYSQDFYHPSHADVDLSDSLPPLDFRVQKVPDSLHLECPHCEAVFTLSKRRHHCRLCGDVFCDACSSHRAQVPLEGPEFDQPVRICDFCNEDVEKGNFFTLRRYLTPLQLYDPTKYDSEEEASNKNQVATAQNVNAALSALSTDLESLLHNSSSFAERVTIPNDILVPAIVKHLHLTQTANRAVRALASLLALGSLVGKNDFAQAVFFYGGPRAVSDILVLLEKSGSDRKTLFVQEQAARALFYLTDPSVLSTLTSKQEQLQHKNEDAELGGVESLDMDRTLRNMLDHSSLSKNPALQRWSAATIRNLVVEDQRRTCLAANDVAAAIASGQEYSAAPEYTSFLDQFVSTGGIMILSSLIGADDPDTRAHATGALGAILSSTRAIDASLETLREMTGQGGSAPAKDGDIVRAIVSGGACGSSLSQLLLSADNSVAAMGCDFASSLVMPILEDPRGTATLPSNYDCHSDNDGLGACREAALAMATGSCLPALLSLVRDPELGGRISRPVDLRKNAMETLAAVVTAVAEMAKANDSLPQLREAVGKLVAEGAVSVCLAILQSSSSQSLVASRDTPAIRIREATGIVLSAMTACSEDAIVELESQKVFESMLAVAGESGMMKPSTLRGDGAPRCLGMLETAAMMLMRTWEERTDVPQSDLIDKLFEAVSSGAIPILSRILFQKMDWESKDKSVGDMKARESSCRMLGAMFAIARNDETGMGQNRLYETVDSDAYSRDPPHNVVTGALSILQTSSKYARRALMGGGIQGEHYHAALMDLVEAALLAAGSMCGSSIAPGDSHLTQVETMTLQDAFKSRTQDACKVACDILVNPGRQGSLLPTMLVGGFGEGAVNSSLRLALAIAQHGNMEQHAKLAMSGILVPISDSLRNALSGGDLYRFSVSLALVRFCGPHVAAGEGGGLKSVRDAIQVATSVLTLPVDPHGDMSVVDLQESLKAECIETLEALSNNASLWSAISEDALPSIVSYLHGSCSMGMENPVRLKTRCAALRAILKIVQVPSHALSAAKAGLVEPLAVLLRQGAVDDSIPLLALEILHVLASSDEPRHYAQLLESGAFQGVCSVLGRAATNNPKQPTDSRADIAFWGLEILHLVISDLEKGSKSSAVLQSAAVLDVVDIIARETDCLRALCATMLLQTNMKLPQMDSNGEPFRIPSLFGPPFVLVQEACAGFANTHEAAKSFLFSVAVYASASDTKSADKVWETLLIRKVGDSDAEECDRLAATFSAYFLSLLTDDGDGFFMPYTKSKQSDFETIRRPLVRHRLLEGLKTSVEEQSENDSVIDDDSYMKALLVGFHVPQLCLSLSKDHTVFDLAYDLTKLMISLYEDDVLTSFVDSKSSMLSLFDMLNTDLPMKLEEMDGEEVRRFVASILGSLAHSGQLTHSVDQFDVRESAIAALASACLAEDEVVLDDDGDAPATSSRTSSRCMECLVELCTFEQNGRRGMKLTSGEAVAIAKHLGKKVCLMVTSRFLERAKLEQYNVSSPYENILEAADVTMLCAVAQHADALEVLGSIGGLHALSLVAAEGEISAVIALQKACKENASLLLEVNGHNAIMALFGPDSKLTLEASDKSRRQIEAAAFGLLAELCKDFKGLHAVTTNTLCSACVSRAEHLVSDLIVLPIAQETSDNPASDDPASDGESNDPLSAPEEVDEDVNENDENLNTGCQEENKETPVIVEKTGLLPGKEAKEKIAPATVKNQADTALECSAIVFLTSIVKHEPLRLDIIQRKELIDATFLLGRSGGSSELKYEVARLLLSLAPYATLSGNRVSVAALAAVFRDMIILPSKGSQWWTLNALESTAAEGLGVVFECNDVALQQSIVQRVTDRFAVLVTNCSVTRAPGSEEERAHGARLACALSLLLLQAMGKKGMDTILSSSKMLTSVVHVTQWRYDPKTSSEEDDCLHWNATVCHCLQIMACLLSRTSESLDRAGISLRDLARTVLMMSRPGRAPRKSIDFLSALGRVLQENKDMASCVAARRILNRLENK